MSRRGWPRPRPTCCWRTGRSPSSGRCAPDDGRRCTSCTSGSRTRRSGCGSSASARHAAHAYVDHVLAHPEHARPGRRAARAAGRPRHRRADDPIRAEVAFLVADDARGQGVGTLLLEHLAALALARGITELEADVLSREPRDAARSSPTPASPTSAASSWAPSCSPSAPAPPWSPRPAPTPASSAPRRARSSRCSGPASVAVVGARSDGTGIGATVLRSIVAGGFTGRVVAVHPRADELAGVPTYASLRDVPSGLDLVVVCVPAGAWPWTCFRDAVAAGVRAAVIVSSGFGELGAEGARIQHELVDARPRPRRAGGRPQLPRAAAQPPRPPAQRDLQRRRPARRRPRRGQPVRRRRHRAHGPRPRARARRAHLRLARQQGRRLQQRPARGLVRRPRGHRRRALPRVVRQLREVRAVRAAVRRSASRCSPSSAAARPAAAGPAPRTPPRPPRPGSGWTPCSPRPA